MQQKKASNRNGNIICLFFALHLKLRLARFPSTFVFKTSVTICLQVELNCCSSFLDVLVSGNTSGTISRIHDDPNARFTLFARTSIVDVF